jgi:hypothetical protein
MIDGVKGNVLLRTVDSHLLSTTVVAVGNLESKPGEQGKTTMLDLDGRDSRIQDLLRLFVTADRPPVDGPIVFRAHVVLPPNGGPFLRRVRLDGDFGIKDAEFTNPNTQANVDKLSERARKNKSKDKYVEDPERVFSNVKGHVDLRNGVAILSNLSFGVPGALVRADGTYNLITEAIDLHGTLTMEATISQAAGGFKSILLKPFDPFFRKKPAGAVVPVRMTGTYSHPVFAVSPFGKK